MAAYFDAIIHHGEAGDILRNIERAIERLAFVRACIIPFTVDADGELHQDAYHPIEVISKRLGHSTIGVTVDRYVTVYRDRDAAAAEAFERVMA